jgi:hypothetical protein
LTLRFVTFVDESYRFEPLLLVDSPNPGSLVVESFEARSKKGGPIAKGSLIYTPPPGFVGDDSFGFVISDGTARTEFTVIMTVLPATLPLEDVATVPTTVLTVPTTAPFIQPVSADLLPFTGPSIPTVLGLVSGLLTLACGVSLLRAERKRREAD